MVESRHQYALETIQEIGRPMVQQSSSGYITKEIIAKIRKRHHTTVFTAALFTTAKAWKQLTDHQQMNGLKKMYSILTMEYY